MNYVLIDLETTGALPKNKEIIELAAIKIDKDGRRDVFQCFLKPKQCVDPFIFKLTRIKPSDLDSAPVFEEIYESLALFLKGAIIIAHNVAFDISVLNREVERISKPVFQNLIADSADIALILMPGLKKQGLKALANTFEIQFENQHRALADVECLEKIINLFKEKAKKLDPIVLQPLLHCHNKTGLYYWFNDNVKHWPAQHKDMIWLESFLKRYNSNKASRSQSKCPAFLNTISTMPAVFVCPNKELAEKFYVKFDYSALAFIDVFVSEFAFQKQFKMWSKEAVLQAALLQWWIQTVDCSFSSMHARLRQSFKKGLLTKKLPSRLHSCSYLICSIESFNAELKALILDKGMHIYVSNGKQKQRLTVQNVPNINIWPTSKDLAANLVLDKYVSPNELVDKLKAFQYKGRSIAVYCRSQAFKEQLSVIAKQAKLFGLRDMATCPGQFRKKRYRSIDLYTLNEYSPQHFEEYKMHVFSGTRRKHWNEQVRLDWCWYQQNLC